MTNKQLLIVEGDAAAALSIFGPEVEVLSAKQANGQLRDRHVILMGDGEFCQAFAREIHGHAASVSTCVQSEPLPTERAKAFAWAKSVKKPYQPESVPPGANASSLAAAPSLSPEAQTPDRDGPDENLTAQVPVSASLGSAAVEPTGVPDAASNPAPSDPNPVAQVDPETRVDTGSMEPAPLEPLGRDLSDSPVDWTRDIPPDPQTSAKPPKTRRKPRLAAVDGNLARQPEPDAEPMPADLSEDALAGHFIETYGENWRYVPEWAVWLQWRGDGWYRDTKHEVGSVLMRVTREALQWREAQALTADGKRKINSKKTAWNARDVSAVDPRISILAEELDADPLLLGVPGGAVDLTTGKLLDPDPTQYVTRRTSVAPQDGPTPLFDRVLARAENSHEGMRDYLLRALGYCLTGNVSEEVFFYLSGLGGSGKGTLTAALQAILGDYADTVPMDALIESKQARHSQEIAKLEGKRLVFANENEEGRRFNEGLIKWLTGGDVITAHRMRCDDRNFKPTFKLLLSGNSVPHLKSVADGAMKRRVHLIEYAEPLSEEDRDTTLKARMVDEYPAILALLIRGCVDWQQCGGLGKPESVSASVDNYLDAEDTLGAFLDEAIERETGGKELSGDVYRRYKAWTANAGEYVLSQKRLTQVLALRGFEPKRSNGLRWIYGLKLRSAPQEYPPTYSDRD